MDDSAIAVFTNRGRDRLINERGSQAWALDPKRAAMCSYLVCIQNRASEKWGNPTHPHRHAFLVAKNAGVSPSRESTGRFMIHFTEFAEVDVLIDEKWRNPVRYTTLTALGINPDTLKFRRVRVKITEEPAAPDRQPVAQAQVTSKLGLDIASAKAALAQFYGVSVDAIEIVIRG